MKKTIQKSGTSATAPSKKLGLKKDALKDLAARPRKGQAVKGAGRGSMISA